MLSESNISSNCWAPKRGLLELVEAHGVGQFKEWCKDEMLYWQGDLAESLFLIAEGAVKVFCISPDGKACTFDILGRGSLVGTTAFVLERNHESMARTLRDTQAYVISHGEFDRLLSADPRATMALLRQSAGASRSLARQVQELSFLDVRERLRSRLAELADRYGFPCKDGTRIDLGITHEEIAEMIAANRSTVTSYLSGLEEDGLLYRDKRGFILLPDKHTDILEELTRAVVGADYEAATTCACRARSEGVDPLKTLDALVAGMKRVDEEYTKGRMNLPDLIGAAYAMQRAIPLVEREMVSTDERRRPTGTVVVGTMYGDIHSLGKMLVAMLLRAEGFRVVDLGVNVNVEQFIDAVRTHEPNVLALSALMSVAALGQERVVQGLEEAGLRDSVKIIVGGGALNAKLAEEWERTVIIPPRAGRSTLPGVSVPTMP